MKSFLQKFIIIAAFTGVLAIAPTVEAQQNIYVDPYPYNQGFGNTSPAYYPQNNGNTDVIIAQLIQIIEQLQLGNYNYTLPFGFNGGNNYGFTPVNTGNTDPFGSFDQEPRVETEDADDEDEDSAELNGRVDMNDFRNGTVFFVYGQDEDMIEDVERDYDSYDEVEDDEEDDDFEVVRVDRDLDDSESYSEDVDGLEEDEDYYFIICVEYDDFDNDETLECGDVEEFETDEDNNNDDEPEVETSSVTNITNSSARLRGDVDMNDFDDGIVFFVYGTDDNMIEDIEDDYDSYDDVEDDEDFDDFIVRQVDSNLDGRESYQTTVSGLRFNTDYSVVLCVEYDDDDNDETLECGSVREFETT